MPANTLDFGTYTLEMPIGEFDSDKDKDKFIKKCVGIARSLPEYKEWVKYVKDMLGYRTCSLTGENGDEVTVEIHHHPLTMFDITSIIIDTYLKNNKKFTSMNILNDVMTLHYNNKVGFIPLCTTYHEKYHNGYAVIPPKLVIGEWNYLLETVGYEVNQDIVNKCSELMSESNNETINGWRTVMGGVLNE